MRNEDGTTRDITGETFGLLTAVSRAPNDKFGTIYWNCTCQCGETKLVRANQLRHGKFFTCGKPLCRFWEKVYIPGSSDGCWEWTGALHDEGYGILKVLGKTVRAHVFSYELINGLVPDNLFVLHTCDNRKCVRVDHLFLGTHADNMADMAGKGRAATTGKVFLLPSEKQRMKELYQLGGLSHPDLAAQFHVSLITVRRTLRRASSRR